MTLTRLWLNKNDSGTSLLVGWGWKPCSYRLPQRWAHYGLQAICGPRGHYVRPQGSLTYLDSTYVESMLVILPIRLELLSFFPRVSFKTAFLLNQKHKRTAGDAVASPTLKNWPLFGQQLSKLGQSIQLHSHVSEAASIYQTKAK